MPGKLVKHTSGGEKERGHLQRWSGLKYSGVINGLIPRSIHNIMLLLRSGGKEKMEPSEGSRTLGLVLGNSVSPWPLLPCPFLCFLTTIMGAVTLPS